ncbi:choice-of-anchor H family protein [Alteromonas antoniana]|uniref:choice-of-anchor H family protein n=1 Tax=Alteromonas antoniana TaxID=2803813 RepID=UPI001C47F3B9|nr:choice-of-anchor H family protein [Alteromonas antoniana]
MKKLTFTKLLIAAGILTLSGPTAVLAEDIKVTTKEYQFKEPVKTSTVQTTASISTKKQALETIKGKSRESSQSLNDTEFWIYDSWVTVQNDYDYDGYYTTLNVEFDADTVFSQVPVYAVIYLGKNEVFDSIHVTSVFNIYGDDSNDAFIIESDLVSGFPPYDYEILIELYDADHDVLVAASDGYWDADLAYVSLESENYDVVEETVVVVEEHGGALFIPALLGLFGVALYRRKQ